jgi:acyl dehydratase
VSIDYDTILNWSFEDIVQTYTQRDSMLYALGLGLGFNQTDTRELRFVYEAGLQTFPTMPVVLGHPGPWMTNPRAAINMVKVLHAEQHLDIHIPLPPEGTVIAKNRVREVVDKGAEKGALIITERKIYDRDAGDCYCTQKSVAFARGDGGFGGPVTTSDKPATIPGREPDFTVDIPVSTQSALLYRLSGDYNPLHADPEIAQKAGFDRPILHGLASFGVAARALLGGLGIEDSSALTGIGLRFSAPVYPGEVISTSVWEEAGKFNFRSRVNARDVTVLNNGYAELSI